MSITESEKIQFYLAPMESVTGYVYRNAYHAMFGDMDKYVTPFIAPSKKKLLKTRERKDVAPEHNQGMYVVPQILTNDAEQFLTTCNMLAELGYQEVNLNLGCPMATVVSKKKGSGFLEDSERLDRFFDAVFEGISKLPEERSCKVSVKTRIGVEFAEALKECVHPVCYNGDIFMVEDYHVFREKFPQVDRIMLGRGVIANPGLVREIRTGQSVTTAELKEYHDRLYAGYREEMDCERDALFKMKEVWFYLGKMFPEAERELKKVKKAERPEEYLAAVRSVFTLPVHALQ